MLIAEFEKLYADGITKMIATTKTGETVTLRLFQSVNGMGLCYFKKGSHRRGYRLSNIVDEIESVKYSTKVREVKSVIENKFDMLRKYKKAFTETMHPNLWDEYRISYTNLNISELELEVSEMSPAPQTTYDFYTLLKNKAVAEGLTLITENNYKTTTIGSNKPLSHYRNGYQYQICTENIAGHLANKEDFHYSWTSRYDVSVSGKMCEDGIYRAWISLEYRRTGNGHYYLLINENTAVFDSDD